MSKHVGIVGVSAPGAALCFQTLCTEGESLYGKFGHPEVSMHTLPLGEYMKAIWADNWFEVARLMVKSSQQLEKVGADFVICPDNTVHQPFDEIEANSPLPWLHIADAVGDAATERGFGTLGVMGTRCLMEGPVYPSRLESRGIEVRTPGGADRERIDRIIFDELIYGRIEESSRAFFYDVITRLAGKGCDAVVLGCTEIPLIVREHESPLPTLDSTRLLARAALLEASVPTQDHAAARDSAPVRD